MASPVEAPAAISVRRVRVTTKGTFPLVDLSVKMTPIHALIWRTSFDGNECAHQRVTYLRKPIRTCLTAASLIAGASEAQSRTGCRVRWSVLAAHPVRSPVAAERPPPAIPPPEDS